MLKKENIMIIQKRKEWQVQKRHDDKKESIKQYKKEKYAENRTSDITYQKAKHQENPEMQIGI